MTARPSRRTLLATGLGLVVGAGATQAGNAVADQPAPVSPRPPAPGEELMTEHGVLKRVLLAYRAMIDQLDAGKPPPAGAVTDAAQIISDYVESFHEGLEEAYVFPRVRDQHARLVQTLLTQHDRGRHLTAAISTTAVAVDSPAARSALRRYLGLFVRMYEPHEAWEDTV
ncbi:MAG TPA: hemerythrin domain-containing protein, partial [Streptosporangiaceae bacterium]